MSEVKKEKENDKVWVLPVFPAARRLLTDKLMVSDNYDKQCQEANLFRRRRNDKGQKQSFECCRG